MPWLVLEHVVCSDRGNAEAEQAYVPDEMFGAKYWAYIRDGILRTRNRVIASPPPLASSCAYLVSQAWPRVMKPCCVELIPLTDVERTDRVGRTISGAP